MGTIDRDLGSRIFSDLSLAKTVKIAIVIKIVPGIVSVI
jgi:hypothetical protein